MGDMADTGALFAVKNRRWQSVLFRVVGIVFLVVGGLFTLVAVVESEQMDGPGPLIAMAGITVAGALFVLLAIGTVGSRSMHSTTTWQSAPGSEQRGSVHLHQVGPPVIPAVRRSRFERREREDALHCDHDQHRLRRHRRLSAGVFLSEADHEARRAWRPRVLAGHNPTSPVAPTSPRAQEHLGIGRPPYCWRGGRAGTRASSSTCSITGSASCSPPPRTPCLPELARLGIAQGNGPGVDEGSTGRIAGPPRRTHGCRRCRCSTGPSSLTSRNGSRPFPANPAW